jgi:hypothetical protein
MLRWKGNPFWLSYKSPNNFATGFSLANRQNLLLNQDSLQRVQYRELEQENTVNRDRIVLGNGTGFGVGLQGLEAVIPGVGARIYSLVGGLTFCY